MKSRLRRWTIGFAVAAAALVAVRVTLAFIATPPRADPPVATHGGDVYGDPLPEGAVARLGTIRFRGKGPAVWAPDGDHLFVGGWNDEILAMNAKTGLVDWTLPGHSQPFMRNIEMTDLDEMWRVIRRGEVPLEDDALSGLTMFSDGRRLLSQGYSLRIWDLPSRAELKVIPLRGGTVSGGRISPDGTLYAFAWIDCVRIVDLVAGKERRKTCVGVFDDKIQITAQCVAWAGDGARVFAGLQDGRVAVVSVHGESPVSFPLSDCAVDALLVADGGRTLWTLDHKGVVRGLSLASAAVAPRRIELGAVGDPKRNSWRGTLVESADGRVVATCDGVATKTFDASTGALVENSTAGGVAWPIGWSPDGTRYAEWTGGGVRVAGGGAPTETVAGRRCAAAWASDGRRVATASRYFGTHCVSVWDAATGREIWTRRYEEPDWISSVAWTADGAGVRASAHKRIVEFDAATGAERWTHAVGSESQATWPRMEPRGEGAVWVDGERDLHFVDLRTERREVGVAHLATKPSQDGPSFAVLPGLAGAVLLECVPTKVADDGRSWSGKWRVRRWRVGGAAPEASIDALGTAVFCATGDGRFAAAGDSPVAVYDLASDPPREIGRTPADPTTTRFGRPTASAVAISPDASLLAVGDWAGTVRVWSVPGCALVKTLRGHRGKIECLAFSDDGSRLVSGSVDATALVWPLK